MGRVLPGGATLEEVNAKGKEQPVACRPLAAVEVRTRPGPVFFPCPQCKTRVSMRAETCPHCGCPLDSLVVPVAEPPAQAEKAGDGPGRV